MKLINRRIALTTPLVAYLNAVHAEPNSVECPSNIWLDPAKLLPLAKEKHPDRGILWSVSKDGRTSYLYATIHAAKIEWDFPGPKIAQIIKDSSCLAVELDISKSVTVSELKKGLNFEDNSIPEDLRKRINTLFDQSCLSGEKAYLNATASRKATLLMLYAASSQGISPEYGIDIALIGYFKYLKKSILEVETPAQQISAMRGNINTIRKSIDQIESGQTAKNFEALTNAWSQGNLAAIAEISANCDCYYSKAEEVRSNALMQQRNLGMAESLDKIFTGNDRALAALGALHMLGENSVIFLLGQRGYDVQRVI